MVCWLTQSGGFRDNFTENDWLTFMHWPSTSMVWGQILQTCLGAALLTGTRGHQWDWLGLIRCRHKSWASGRGARTNLIHEGGKAHAAGGTAGPGIGRTVHAHLLGWCNIVICLKEKRAMSLHQGLDPKSTEVKEGLLKIARHFESTLRCREQPSLALMASEVYSFQHCCNFPY